MKKFHGQILFKHEKIKTNKKTEFFFPTAFHVDF